MAQRDGNARTGAYSRATSETNIDVVLNVDGSGKFEGNSGIGFLDHMLRSFATHSMIDLKVVAKGDLWVDQHHLVEDLGICLGSALKQALGDMGGIYRFGWAFVPMDEALVYCAIDIGGRPFCMVDLPVHNAWCGEFQADLVEEFYRGLSTALGSALHIKAVSARNVHHVVEASFKAFALSVRQATTKDFKRAGVASTKGVIGMA